MVSANQPSFAKGEIAPSLYGRVDTAAYQVALRRARNVMTHAYGGVSNRGGLRFLAPVRDHANPPRLIPFQFKTTDTYQLEFGAGYMRVMRNDAHVVEAAVTITGATQADPVIVTATGHGYSNGDEVYISGVGGMTDLNGNRYLVNNVTTNTFELTSQVTGVDIDGTAFGAYTSGGEVARIYEIATPYALADLPQLKYVQSADVMTLTHKDYPVYELSRLDHDSWTLAEATFQPDIAAPTNQAVSVGTAGADTVRYRVTAIAQDTGEESLPALSGSGSAGISAVTKANPAVVTAAGHGFANGAEIYISGVGGMTELNGRRFVVANATTNTFELEDEDSTDYNAYTSGGTAYLTYVEVTTDPAYNNTISWTGVSAAIRYAVYREFNGLYGLIGETEDTTFLDGNITADYDITPPRARDPFRGAGNYPGVASYYEQRRVFGATDNDPDTSWYTRPGAYGNLAVSQPLQDNDAITVTLAARQVNEIRHFVPGNDLLILTNGSEWRVNSGSDAAFSYATLRQKPQSYWGCSHRQPIVVGTTTLFVQENDASIRSLGYSLQKDGYVGSDLTLLVPHFFRDETVAHWDFSRYPDPIVHVVMSDGTLCSMTFNEEQEVIAWSKSETDGEFLCVSVVRPSADEKFDAPYFVVRRKIDGNTVCYIERFDDRSFDGPEDCFFVDSGLSLDVPFAITGISMGATTTITAPGHDFVDGDLVDLTDIVWESSYDADYNETQPDQLNGRRYKAAGAATNTFRITDADTGAEIDSSAYEDYGSGGKARQAVTTLGGLEHLEGREVVILADGNVVEGKTVSSGIITLDRAASRVHVGLRYIADIETLNIEAPQGTIQGKPVSISAVAVLFERSRGLLIGPSPDLLTEIKQRKYEKMGQPTALLTDQMKVTLKPDWNGHGRVYMRQIYPLPMTVLAVTADLEIGD